MTQKESERYVKQIKKDGGTDDAGVSYEYRLFYQNTQAMASERCFHDVKRDRYPGMNAHAEVERTL